MSHRYRKKSAIKKMQSQNRPDRTTQSLSNSAKIATLKEFFSQSEENKYAQLDNVRNLLTQLTFFRNLEEEHSRQALDACLIHLNYEFFECDSTIFREKEQGRKFYIILQGSVQLFKEEEGVLIENCRLKAGESFGERALLLNQSRSATITASTACHLASMDYTHYKTVLNTIFDEHFQQLSRLLRRLPALKDLSQTLLQKICYKFKKRLYCKREAIYTEGSPIKAVYLIYRGEVRVSKKVTIANKPQVQFPSSSILRQKSLNEVVQLAAIGAGELVGEEDLIEGQERHSTSCVAYTDVWLYSLSKDSFFKILMNHEEAEVFKRKSLAKQTARRELVAHHEQLLRLKSGISPLQATPVRSTSSLAKELPRKSTVLNMPLSPMQALTALSHAGLPKLGPSSTPQKKVRALQKVWRPLREYLGEKPQTPKKQQKWPCVNIHVSRVKNHRSSLSCFSDYLRL